MRISQVAFFRHDKSLPVDIFESEKRKRKSLNLMYKLRKHLE